MQRKEKDNQLIFIDYLIFSRQKATTDFTLLSPSVGQPAKLSKYLEGLNKIVSYMEKNRVCGNNDK